MRIKKITLLLLCALLFCAVFSLGVSAERVSVTGSGTAPVKAETARIHLAIRAEGRDEKSAAEENRARLNVVRKLLGEKSDISETGYYIAAEPQGERVTVTRTLIALVAAERAEHYVTDLTALLGTEFYGVSYHAENTAEAEESALKAAIEEAKKKAEALGIAGKALAFRECESYLTDEGGQLTLHARVELLLGEECGGERPPLVSDTKDKREK